MWSTIIRNLFRFVYAVDDKINTLLDFVIDVVYHLNHCYNNWHKSINSPNINPWKIWKWLHHVKYSNVIANCEQDRWMWCSVQKNEKNTKKRSLSCFATISEYYCLASNGGYSHVRISIRLITHTLSWLIPIHISPNWRFHLLWLDLFSRFLWDLIGLIHLLKM